VTRGRSGGDRPLRVIRWAHVGPVRRCGARFARGVPAGPGTVPRSPRPRHDHARLVGEHHELRSVPGVELGE